MVKWNNGGNNDNNTERAGLAPPGKTSALSEPWRPRTPTDSRDLSAQVPVKSTRECSLVSGLEQAPRTSPARVISAAELWVSPHEESAGSKGEPHVPSAPWETAREGVGGALLWGDLLFL